MKRVKKSHAIASRLAERLLLLKIKNDIVRESNFDTREHICGSNTKHAIAAHVDSPVRSNIINMLLLDVYVKSLVSSWLYCVQTVKHVILPVFPRQT